MHFPQCNYKKKKKNATYHFLLTVEGLEKGNIFVSGFLYTLSCFVQKYYYSYSILNSILTYVVTVEHGFETCL